MPNLSEEQWRLFSDYLDRALELPESERAPWLAELACTHPDIAAEIERALAVRDRKGYGEFLSDSPFPSPPVASATLIGRRVGPYLIEAETGRGGMGSVWRARRADGRFGGTGAGGGARGGAEGGWGGGGEKSFAGAGGRGGAGEERFRSEGRMLGRLD